MSEKGIKRESRVDCVYKHVDAEYERLDELEVERTGDLPMDIPIHALHDSESPVRPNDMHARSGKSYLSLINYKFVYRYRQWPNLVPRKKRVKKSLSRTFEIWNEQKLHSILEIYTEHFNRVRSNLSELSNALHLLI